MLRSVRVITGILLCTGMSAFAAAPVAAQTPTPTEVSTQTPTPTPGGDCCAAHGGPGCDNTACQQCVCATVDGAFCCTGFWDATCVEIARTADECATMCPCAPIPTATPFVTPTPGGDCCSAHAGFGCDETSCQQCVCGVEGQEPCCSDTWDPDCAAVARVECAGFCPCDEGECCDGGRDTPGCEGSACEDCVCAIDEACCAVLDGVWDGTCVDIASNPDECAGSCPCTPADCCIARDEEPGCESAVCLDCVCAIDPECCSVIWDAPCVAIANNADECLGSCPCNEGDCCAGHTGPGCEGSECNDCVCNADEQCCLNGWDATCAAEAMSTEECAGSCGCAVTTDCCTMHDTAGCSDQDCVDCVCALPGQEFCCTGEWDATCAAVAASASECAGQCPCGAGDCCAPRETAGGCELSECEDCVCAFDAACCTGIWDAICVEIASTDNECNPDCNCVEESDCCRPQTVPGCEDGGCAECVCSTPGQESCCTAVWDEICVEVAGTECAASCPCGGPTCPGDCDGSDDVAVNELVTGVNIALDLRPIADCRAFDTNASDTVEVGELITGVNRALEGC